MTKDFYSATWRNTTGSFSPRTMILCFSFKWTPHSQWLCRMLWLMAVTCNKAMNVVLGVPDSFAYNEGVKNKKVGVLNRELCYECLESEFQQWQFQQQQQDE